MPPNKRISRKNRASAHALGLSAKSYASSASQWPRHHKHHKHHKHLPSSNELLKTTWHIKPTQRLLLHKITFFFLQQTRESLYRELSRRDCRNSPGSEANEYHCLHPPPPPFRWEIDPGALAYLQSCYSAFPDTLPKPFQPQKKQSGKIPTGHYYTHIWSSHQETLWLRKPVCPRSLEHLAPTSLPKPPRHIAYTEATFLHKATFFKTEGDSYFVYFYKQT